MSDDLFREIDSDMRAERVRARTRRLALVGLTLLVLAGLVIGVWQYLAYRQRSQAAAVAVAFFAAQKDADTAPASAAGPDAPPTPEQRRAVGELAQVAGQGPAGFATLARLRLADLTWDAGDHAKALSLWDQVSQDRAANTDLRGLGDLLWVQHQLDGADPSLLKTRLRDILKPDSPWRLLAMEADALVDLRTGDLKGARARLGAIAQDGAATDAARARASGLLDTLDTSKTGG